MSTSILHRPRLYQALALFFVVLHLLASARGLVPGLCLNLRAPAASQAQTCFENADRSCCSARNTVDEGAPDTTPKSPRRCPFCRLALGLTEPPEYVHFEPLAAVPMCLLFPPAARFLSEPAGHTFSGRSPPELFLA